MDSNIINLEKTKDPDTILKLLLCIIRSVNVNHIYLLNRTYESTLKYRFVIIVEEMAKRFKERARATIEDFFSGHSEYDFYLFTLHMISNETNNGTTFFLNNCIEDNLVYYNNIYNKQWLFKQVDLGSIVETSKQNFSFEKERIEAFKTGASFFLKDQNYGQAAFMLHQSIELAFMIAERYLMGFSFKSHLISDHQNFIGNVAPEFGSLFPRGSEEETALLNKLNNAYTKTRYALNFKISKEQVLSIEKKSEKLIDLLAITIETEITKCENALQSVYFSLDNSSSIPTSQKPKSEPSKLEDIYRLSKENLKLLTPIGGIQEGYYLNFVQVYNYVQLFDTLKSMLNVCILGLDEQQDYTINILNKESDVKKVLEFSKNLIPLEEGNYLDRMRELILSKEDNSI
tara:strand:+ start:69295 stop:70500 length:1206 start_codon:yes stop_codon:yes gene_type:complete